MQRGLINGIKQLFIPASLGGGDAANDGALLGFDSTQPGGVKPVPVGTYVQAFGIVRPVFGWEAASNITVRSANFTHYYRVVEGGTISKLRVNVGVQSGNVCVSVHANTGTGINAAPGTRQATSGSVACPAAGIADISLGGSVVVNAGDWIAIGCDNVTAKFTGTNGAGILATQSGILASQGVFPAPVTPSGLNAGDNNALISIIGVP